MKRLPPFPRDALERIGATAVAAVLGVAVVYLTDIPAWWAPVLISGFTAVKTQVARYVGQSTSASLLPEDHGPTGTRSNA